MKDKKLKMRSDNHYQWSNSSEGLEIIRRTVTKWGVLIGSKQAKWGGVRGLAEWGAKF